MPEYYHLNAEQKEQVKAIAKHRGLTVEQYMETLCNKALYKCSGANKGSIN